MSKISCQPQTSEVERYWTVSEANAALPYVEVIVNDAMEVYVKIQNKRLDIRYAERANSPDLPDLDADLDRAMVRLAAILDEFTSLGVELDSVFTGTVDFPAVYAGREGMLTWKLGDSSVTCWHEYGSGCGRHSVKVLAGT